MGCQPFSFLHGWLGANRDLDRSFLGIELGLVRFLDSPDLPFGPGFHLPWVSDGSGNPWPLPLSSPSPVGLRGWPTILK